MPTSNPWHFITISTTIIITISLATQFLAKQKIVRIILTVITMIEFLLTSLFAGLGIACIAGPLGSFVVWRRMAYFGDTLAHASLMGLALGFLLDINLYLLLTICCLALAVILVTLQKQRLMGF